MEKSAQQIVEMYSCEGSELSVEDQIVATERSICKKAGIPAIVIGIVGCLIMGVGMSLTMVTGNFLALGIVVGVMGIVVICANYPLYKRRLENLRESARRRIMELALHL